MSDYWYDNKSQLKSDLIFITDGNEVVKLDRSVPGDATKWYIADLYKSGWCYNDSTVEATELNYLIG